MDIILCRNVFIYFDSQTVSAILKNFYNPLGFGGFLIAGHTELHGENFGQLQAKFFPESVVYHHSEEKLCETPCLSARLPISSDLSISNPLHKQQNYTTTKGVAVP
jgi:chemotaxis protein methyltransferase CheR